MLMMSDGSLAIAGKHWKIADGRVSWADMLVARIHPTSGAIDRQFGHRGTTTVDFGTRGYRGAAVPASLKEQPDGKLVIIGSQADRYDWYYAYSIAVARVDPYGAGSNGWVGLADTHATVPPAGNTITLNLRRTGGRTDPRSVGYRTVDGTAIAGKHYAASSGTATWADGDLEDKTLSITILNTEPEADFVAFDVELFNSSGGLAIDQSTVSISPPAPSPATPPPNAGGSNRGVGGGGAIGIELWCLFVSAVFVIVNGAGRSVRRADRWRALRLHGPEDPVA